MMPKGYRHGLRYTPEYKIWIGIRVRCNSPQGHNAFYYNGISICEEWNDPVRFIADMGSRPSKNHQIDRIDNTKGYSKDNCRWVERKPQMQNTRISKWWFVDGVRYGSIADAASARNVSISCIQRWCDGRSDRNHSCPPKPNCWSEKKYV